MPGSNTRLYNLFAAMTLLLSACSAGDRAYDGDVRAIEIGGSAIDDACGGSGIVREDLHQVVVRSAPSPKAGQLDLLPGGTVVWFCDQAPGWLGVVYAVSEREDCGVATPAAEKTPYSGPCKAGWIERADVTLLAG